MGVRPSDKQIRVLYVPVNYTNTSTNLGGHLEGIDNALGAASGSVPSIQNKDLAASTTVADEDPATAAPVLGNPVAGGFVGVVVNGLEVGVGDGVKTLECYFSGDGGTTARAQGAIQNGDVCYWMGSNAQYELDATQDVISFYYNE